MGVEVADVPVGGVAHQAHDALAQPAVVHLDELGEHFVVVPAQQTQKKAGLGGGHAVDVAQTGGLFPGEAPQIPVGIQHLGQIEVEVQAVVAQIEHLAQEGHFLFRAVFKLHFGQNAGAPFLPAGNGEEGVPEITGGGKRDGVVAVSVHVAHQKIPGVPLHPEGTLGEKHVEFDFHGVIAHVVHVFPVSGVLHFGQDAAGMIAGTDDEVVAEQLSAGVGRAQSGGCFVVLNGADAETGTAHHHGILQPLVQTVAGGVVDHQRLLARPLRGFKDGFRLDALAAEVHFRIAAGGRGAGNMPPVAGNLVGHGPRAGGNAGPVRRSDGGHGAETVQALHAIFIYLFEVGQDAFLDMFFHNM